MKIRSIHLKNYKRFFDLKIELGENPKRIIALVGPNGCGKSSVFDAMMYSYSRFCHVGSAGFRDHSYHSLVGNIGYSNDENNINIIFDSGNMPDVLFSRTSNGNEKTIFSLRSPFRYNSNLMISDLRTVDDIRNNRIGASLTSDLDQKIEENYRRLNIKYSKYLNEEDVRPSEAKQHIIGELNSFLEECLDLSIDNLGDIESGRGTLFFRKHDYNSTFTFNNLSAGEKEVVDIILDLYVRKDDYNDSVFLIDEPELHINTSIQRKLLRVINSLIGDNCQIWIATHSIGFLRALQEELRNQSSIIEFKGDNNWASQEYLLTPIIPNRNTWNSIFSTALDDLSNLISPKTIVYCEGRAEPTSTGVERGFDAKVYNTIFSSNYPEVLFVSSGGNTELDQRSDIAISILGKVFSEVCILVLKDLDMASGKEVNEQSRDEYLRLNPPNHRVIKRFEIENYLFDKEVLINYCSNNNKVFDEEAYDAYFVDIVNQNIKGETRRIRNICSINTPVNSNVFKEELAKYFTEDMDVYKELESSIFSERDV